MTGAGVAHAGYGLPVLATRVFNNTSNLLFAGESVDWDPTQAATDLALRVKRFSADASLAYAGVLLKDVPANGGYGDLMMMGRVSARVQAAVTAGALLCGDFVSGTAAGILKVCVPGDYAVAAIALTAAVETPTGSGIYYAQVVPLGPNAAASQALMRGGLTNLKSANTTGLGAAGTFTRQISALFPHSVASFEILSDTAIDGSGAGNTWNLQITRNGGATLFAAALDLRAGVGTNVVAGTVLPLPAAIMQNVVSANPCLYTVTMTKVGTPTAGPDLSAANISFNIRVDPGIAIPMIFGR